jgi:hypothetical protein
MRTGASGLLARGSFARSNLNVPSNLVLLPQLAGLGLALGVFEQRDEVAHRERRARWVRPS